jgi:hypothetical protein
VQWRRAAAAAAMVVWFSSEVVGSWNIFSDVFAYVFGNKHTQTLFRHIANTANTFQTHFKHFLEHIANTLER